MCESSQKQVRGAVAVIMRDERLLVIRRAAGVRAPGQICFPGGGIEPGESESEALRRELQEELSVQVQPVRRIWRSVTPWGVDLAWWTATLPQDSQIVVNPAEVASYHWYTIDELAWLPNLLTSNHDFVDAYRRGDLELDY